MDRKETFADSRLELLPPEILMMILKMTGIGGMKALRMSSKTLRERVDKLEDKQFRHWNYDWHNVGPDQAAELIRFSKEVNIIEDLTLHLDESSMQSRHEDFVDAVKSLLEDHSEIKSIYIHLSFSNILKCSDGRLLNEIIRHAGHIVKSLNLSNYMLSEVNKDSLPCLERLKTDGILCNITDLKLQSILKATEESLVELSLRQTRITGKGLATSCLPLEKLTSLELQDSYDLTDRGLSEILYTFPNLRRFVLSGSQLCGLPGVSGSGVATICKSLKSLTSFCINYCENLTACGLSEMLALMPNVITLDLPRVFTRKLTGEGFSSMCKSLPKVTSLHLSAWNNLTVAGLGEMLNTMPNIQKLVLPSILEASEELIAGLRSKGLSIEFEYVSRFQC